MRIALALALLSFACAAQGAADPHKFMGARLLAETASPRPGSTILIGFRMIPQPGWHGYWSNPGDSGIAPSVHWTIPQGVRVGPLLHPAPTLLRAGGISSFVHSGPHTLLARLSLPRSLPIGTRIPVEAELSWAACTATQCVPLHQQFSLDLVVGDGLTGPDARALTLAELKLPREAAGGTFTASGKQLRLVLPAALHLNLPATRFFPDENGYFRPAESRAAKTGGIAAIVGPIGSMALSKTFAGVVSDGTAAYRIAFTPAVKEATKSNAQTPETSRVGAATTKLAPTTRRSASPVERAPQARAQPEQPGHGYVWALAIAVVVIVAGAAALRRSS